MEKKEKAKETMTEKEAAAYLSFSQSSLNHWRQQGKGPKFIKHKSGAIRYRLCDLKEWEGETTVLAQSTAEARGRAV